MPPKAKKHVYYTTILVGRSKLGRFAHWKSYLHRSFTNQENKSKAKLNKNITPKKTEKHLRKISYLHLFTRYMKSTVLPTKQKSVRKPHLCQVSLMHPIPSPQTFGRRSALGFHVALKRRTKTAAAQRRIGYGSKAKLPS